jgi:hypothetical protein
MEWNDAIAARIFRADMGGREIFLFVNEELIEEIGGAEGIADFVAAIKDGPPWVNPELGLCQMALHAFDGWRNRDCKYPPYIGYLGLFVLAVGTNGRFATHAYYPRLRSLLGWPDVDAGAPPSFDRMLELWEDLEVWSNRDRDGALGIFNIRIAGEWIHVGMPKAQAVLTEHERRGLCTIFITAGIDPAAAPSDAELIRMLHRHGAQILRAQTLELLTNRSSDPSLFNVLLDYIRSELELWDGQDLALEEEQDRSINAYARICLRVDEIVGRVNSTLRVNSRAEFPQSGLLLESEEQHKYSCLEYLPGWSYVLNDKETEQPADASVFSWSETQLLQDSNEGWRVRVIGSRIKIFVKGLEFDIPGYVEVRRLPRSRHFLLAAPEEVVPDLTAWVDSGEVELRELHIRQGLPPRWKLFSSPGASADTAIRSKLPELSLPIIVRVSLRGGIRTGEGNSYFRFAMPAVIVEGRSGEEEVVCNGRRLHALEDTGLFQLPSDFPAEERLTVEVRFGADIVRSQSFFIYDDFEWRLGQSLCSSDRFGVCQEVGGVASDEVVGATGGAPFEGDYPVRRPELPLGKRIFLIGRYVGQIVSYPMQPYPTDWEPIWVIELSRKGKARYCGHNLQSSHPSSAEVGTRDDCLLWKEVLWHRRQRIEKPGHRVLKNLWCEYEEVAKYV